MGFRFRKSVKIAPGVRVNFGKKSSSISFGKKGARYTVSSTGRRTSTFGIPGTGLSYSTSSKKKKKSPKEKPVIQNNENLNKAKLNPLAIRIFILIVAVVMFIYGIVNITSSGWILVIIGAVVILVVLKQYRRKSSSAQHQENSISEDE